MLLRHTHKALSLPDFLVPGLLNYRAASSSVSHTVREEKVSKQYDSTKLAAFPMDRRPTPALYKNITERISALHSGSNTLAPDENINVFNTTATKLRSALKAGDILIASKYWSSLEEKGLLPILGVALVEGYSKLVTNLIPVNNQSTVWTDAERAAAEKIAIGTATIGKATGALSACMLNNIRRGDPDAALELYTKYLSLSEGLVSGNTMSEEVEPDKGPHDQDNTLGLSVLDKTITYSAGRSQVLLMAIAAHAMKDSFTDAVRTYLQTSVRISQNSLKAKSNALAFDPALQAKVELYIPRLHIARLIANPLSFSHHVGNLVNAHAVDRLKKDYNAILQAISEPGAFAVLHPDALTAVKPILFEETSWGCFLTAFLRIRREDLAEKLWDDMVAHNVVPGVITWTALFDGYDSLGKVEETLAGWKTMLSQGVKPNAFTYRALISVLCTARRPDDALKILKEFEEKVSNKSTSSDKSSPLYNTLIHGLLTNSREDDAFSVLQKMQDQGPKPNLVSYNTFLRYFGRKGDFKGLGLILERLTTDGLIGDTYTFTTILSALLKAGREDAEEITFNLIKKQNVAPDIGFYTAIIDHQVRLKDPKNLKVALNILKRMEQDPEVHMNVVPYTSILAGIYRVHWLEPEVANECAEYVVSRMNGRRIRPNRVTYHILISASLENRQPEGLRNALALYREMRKRGIKMANDTWFVLLNGLVERGEWAMANELVGDLRKIGDVKPVGATLELVGRIKKMALQKAQMGPSGYF